MPSNNGQEQWDALEWEKPMNEEKHFWNMQIGTKWLAPVNTIFTYKIPRRTTWHSAPMALHTIGFDCLLAPWRLKTSINRPRSRTFLGTETNRRHNLVMMTTVNEETQQAIVVRPCLPTGYALKTILHGTVVGVVTEDDHVNHGKTASRSGQTSHCRRCYASRTSETDGSPSS